MKKVILIVILPCFFLGGCIRTPSVPEKAPATQPVPSIIDGVWQTDDVDLSAVSPDRKLIALTFDDAPSPKTNALLDVFLAFNKEHRDCPAYTTLFCNGHRFLAHQESLYTAFAAGIELGNHTFSHRNLCILSTSEIAKEIDSVDRLLQEIDQKERHLFRAPYGRLDEHVKSVVKAPIIDWFIDTKDWTERSAEAIVEKTLSHLQDGAIVLLHDGYDSTVEGVKQLLPLLHEAGYQAVTLSQMAKAHGVSLCNGKVYTRARKQ